MQLSARHRRWIYLTGAVLYATGAGWLFDRYLGHHDLPTAASAWYMQVHGAALLAFLIACGALLPNHVVLGWRLGRNRRSGALMLGVVAALVLTGYGLYYAAEERWRALLSLSHWLIGLAAALVLALHVALGKRSAREV